MMTSETRGVARGAIPKRSRSPRGQPVCIISMAQQASPNIMYQSEDLRVQLRRSSTLVVSAISGIELMSDMAPLPLRRRLRPCRRRAHPPLDRQAVEALEVALHPYVDEADEEDHEEEPELGEHEAPLPALDPALEHGRDRVDERQLDVEDHEHQGDQVEPDVEVDPGGAA